MASMVRMQVTLDPETREALRRRAEAEGKSLAAVAREILRGALAASPASHLAAAAPGAGVRALFPFLGIIRDDPEPVAENHDDYLFPRGDE